MKKKMLKGERIFTMVICLVFLVFAFSPAYGATDQEVQTLKQELKAVQEKVETLEKENKEIDERLNEAELHTATDKLSLGVEFRTRADSINYSDIHVAPAPLLNMFFIDYDPITPLNGGFNGATLAEIQALMGLMGPPPPPEKYDFDNDIIFTNKFRLEMKRKVNPNLSFAGRLAAYKVFGDSTGVKFYNGSLGDVTFDGNTSSLPHGDTIRLERAYFNYKKDVGSVPINFSLGRRPSTNGPPLEYAYFSLEGGSPLGSIINWQFDGASLNFGLEDSTGIPGAAFKLCYGVGFESGWGNSNSLSSSADVEDVHLSGFIATLFDNDMTSAVINYAHASDITDGFTGLTVMPFIVSKDAAGAYYFTPNSGAFISRMEPVTNIGDWDAATLLLRSNLSEWLADIDVFLSWSWTHTDPSQISNNPFYELMGQGLLSSNGQLEERDGYSVYAGVIFPMPKNARLGLEYNWGSKYWFNFTGAEDSLVGSKIAARGNVYECYYIQPISSNNFFVTLGARYYDYEYTGSGNPLGKPVKIEDATALDTLMPVMDEVWDVSLSATLRF